MIDNNYIKELDIDLDYEYIYNLVKQKQFETLEGRASHHRNVFDDPYMTNIHEKFPFLSQTYNIYTMTSGIGFPIHIDAKRKCTLNIPIIGTEYSETIFYKCIGIPELKFDPSRIYNEVTSGVEETFRFTLVRPVLFNTTIPHKVELQDGHERVILSWSLNPEYDFEMSKRLFFKSS
jgi:hypothetical protein